MIKFSNPRVAKLFESTVEKDRVVTLAGLYTGLLSNIGVAAAKKMFAEGDNQLVEIDGVTEAEVDTEILHEMEDELNEKPTTDNGPQTTEPGQEPEQKDQE